MRCTSVIFYNEHWTPRHRTASTMWIKYRNVTEEKQNKTSDSQMSFQEVSHKLSSHLLKQFGNVHFFWNEQKASHSLGFPEWFRYFTQIDKNMHVFTILLLDLHWFHDRPPPNYLDIVGEQSQYFCVTCNNLLMKHKATQIIQVSSSPTTQTGICLTSSIHKSKNKTLIWKMYHHYRYRIGSFLKLQTSQVLPFDWLYSYAYF